MTKPSRPHHSVTRSRKHLGLRLKLMTAMVTALLLVGWGSGSWLLWSLNASYEALEREALADDLHRVVDGLWQHLTTLDEVTREWAHWTEMAAFIESGDPVFRDENLNPEGLLSSRIDEMVVLSPSGRLMATVSASNQTPPAKEPAWLSDTTLLAQLDGAPTTADGGRCGLMEHANKLLLACKRSVLDTRGQGPVRGTVVLSRLFNAESVARLAKSTRLQLTLHAPTAHASPSTIQSLSDALGATGSQTLTSEAALVDQTQERLIVSIGLKDISGHEVASLRLTWPRRIAQHGQGVLEEVRIQRWLGGTVLALALLVLLDWLLIAPLRSLHRDITRVTTDGDWVARVDASGHDEIADVARSANRMLDVIQTQVAHLQEESLTDAITDLPNRRAFDQRLQLAIALARRNGRPLSVVLLDLDRFKPYNDRHGHLEGDRVLRTFAQCLRESLHRPGDLPARHGGEEFAVLLEDTDTEGARTCAQAIVDALAALRLPHPLNLPMAVVTCSAGVATLCSEDHAARDLVHRADTALYDAKHNGRNRVCLAAAH